VEKIERLERNLELEHAYKTKRNELIQKNKKEIEREKQYQIETQQRLARKKEEALFELLTNFEDDLGKIAAVSKKYPNKEDYLTHLEELE